MKKTSQNTVFGIGVILLLITSFIFFRAPEEDVSVHQTKSIEILTPAPVLASTAQGKNKNSNIKESDVEQNIVSTSTDTKSSHLDAYDIHKIQLWHEANGYFNKQSLGEYEGYSKDALLRLADSGDLKAMQILTLDAIMRGDNDAAHLLCLKAATYGSTKPLIEASWLLESAYVNSSSAEQKVLLLRESVALLKVAMLRGDTFNSSEAMMDVKKAHQFEPNQGESLGIDQRAQEIYAALEERRMQLGLEEFDNSINPEIKKLADLPGR